MRSVCTLFCTILLGCSEAAVEVPVERSSQEFPLATTPIKEALPTVSVEPQSDLPDWSAGAGRYPYVCEEFELRMDDEGRSRFKRHRVAWTDDDRSRFRKLVGLVAREMGADPKLFKIWALRESTYRPTAVHVLNPDLNAASKAWDRYRWSPERQRDLEGVMKARAGVKDKPYWRAKGALKRIQTFRDNPYYFDEVEYDVHMPNGETLSESRSRWAYGYGAFGFNPTYFVPIWDEKAPPWVFCNEDGIIAAITAVWAARNYQSKCRAQGFKGTYADVNRMFSSGHCDARPSRAALFEARARKVGLSAGRPARLGKKWPRNETDREEIVRHMRAKAVEAGLVEG